MARPEHVEESESGTICRHCGGLVAEDGYAETLAEMTGDGDGDEGGDDQAASTELMHEKAFADAVRQGRR